MAHVLQVEIQNLCKVHTLERIGFLTLTFPDHVTEIKEAQRRFNSLNSNLLKTRYKKAIGVWERQKSGRIHFHLVVLCKEDIRTGIHFGEIQRKNYRSANQALRKEWQFWREKAKGYGFGRVELLPIKSNSDGIGWYVAKYIKKHVAHKLPQDKGARILRFIGFKPSERVAKSKFSWANENGAKWRKGLKRFAQCYGLKSTDDLSRVLGPRWAHVLQYRILEAADRTEAATEEALASLQVDKKFPDLF